MDLKDKLISSFMAFENNVDVEHPVHDVRMAAIKNFEEKGFPSKKEEAWKYTSLNSLQKTDFSIFPKQENTLEYIVPDFVHVLHNGKIVKSGGKELALELEEKGYDWLKQETAV